MDADVIVVGAGLAGLVAAAELADAGRRVAPARPGAGAVTGRAGVLVVRRAVPRRLPRAAPDGHQGLPRPRLAGLAGHARGFDRPTRTTGRAGGPRPTSTSRPGRSAPGCTRRASRSFPVVGWAERGGYRADGHGNSVPRFHVTWGTGPGRRRAVRAAGASRRADAAWVDVAFPAPGRRARRHRRRGRPACAARVLGAERRARAAARPAASEVGDFELRAQAVIVTSGGIGGNHDLVREALAGRGSARRPQQDDHRRAGARRRADARDHRDGRRRGWSTATACGTTPRASELGPDLAAATASGSCRARRRCGSTRRATGCRRRASPASTRSARCEHLRDAPATTTPGSC